MIISGSQATNSDMPDKMGNTFIPFVTLNLQTFCCDAAAVWNLPISMHRLKRQTLNSAMYTRCSLLYVTLKDRLAP